MLPVPLKLFEDDFVMREPVSTGAVEMMVSEPPSSMLRAAPRSAWGAGERLNRTPPESTFPEGGTMVFVGAREAVMESRRMTTSRLCSTRRFGLLDDHLRNLHVAGGGLRRRWS